MGLEDDDFLRELQNVSVKQKAGEECFYAFEDLLRVVGLCKTNKVVILGLEGFEYLHETLRPCDKALADFSSLQATEHDLLVELSVLESQKFLSKMEKPQKLVWSIATERNM